MLKVFQRVSVVLLYWRRCWSPERGRERNDWEGQDAWRWRTGQMRLLRLQIGFGDKQIVEGRVGQWWQTWAVSGPAAPTPSSPSRWRPPLVCSRSEWQSLVSWAPWLWWRPWSSWVPGWAGGKNWTWDRDEDSGQLVCTMFQGGGRQTHRPGQQPYGFSAFRRAIWLRTLPPRWRAVEGRRRSCDGSRVQNNSQTERKNYSAGRPSQVGVVVWNSSTLPLVVVS